MSKKEQELREELRKMQEARKGAPDWMIPALDDRIKELESQLEKENL